MENLHPTGDGSRAAGGTAPVTALRYRIKPGTGPAVERTLDFAETVRRALIRIRAGTSHSAALSGKTRGGEPLEGHLHAHFLPLDEDADGRLDHVAVYAPGGFDADDVGALRMLRTIYTSRGPSPSLELCSMGGPGGPVFGTSEVWRSATPFSLPRFATRGAGKPPRPRDLPEAQLVRELALRGIAAPVRIEMICGVQTSNGRLVAWDAFSTERRKGSSGNGLAGFEIEFAEAVAGPILVGFGCHYGLGAFLPATREVSK